MLRKRTEIGSEFWLEEPEHQAICDRDGIYTISGRTAIDLIIQDISQMRSVRKVYMPAWCCDSMIAPFSDRGIDVSFYDVRFTERFEYLVDENKETDVFYFTNYFGYENTIDINVVKRFKAKGAIILYDRTHSFLMQEDIYLNLADYSFASIRKWMAVICGAVVENVKERTLMPCPYLSLREEAMRMKQVFIAGNDNIAKQDYLRKYGEYEHCLVQNYRNYKMDDISYAIYHTANKQNIITRRNLNARFIYNTSNLKFLFSLTGNACPLFVPVLFPTKEWRDLIRKRLIEADVYLPIHWPKPSIIPTNYEVNKIYDTELSLICDQRYDISDMERMIAKIKQLNN